MVKQIDSLSSPLPIQSKQIAFPALPILAKLQTSSTRCSARAVIFVRRPLPRF